MEAEPTVHLQLLKGVLPAFQTVAEFFISRHPRAERARRKINKESPFGAESFHATVNVHLANLKPKVEACTTEAFCSSTELRAAVCSPRHTSRSQKQC